MKKSIQVILCGFGLIVASFFGYWYGIDQAAADFVVSSISVFPQATVVTPTEEIVSVLNTENAGSYHSGEMGFTYGSCQAASLSLCYGRISNLGKKTAEFRSSLFLRLFGEKRLTLNAGDSIYFHYRCGNQSKLLYENIQVREIGDKERFFSYSTAAFLFGEK